MRHRLAVFFACALVTLTLFAAPAQAACEGRACVSSGPRLASMDSRQATLYNGLASQLTDARINLGVADWNALAQGGTNLGSFLDALAAETGVAGRDEALAGSASLSEIFAAMAAAARREGRSQAAAALDTLASATASLGGTLRLADLIDTGGGASEAISLGTLDLVAGLVQLYDADRVAAAGEPVLLSGEALGLAGVVDAVRLSARTTEPPVFRCGPAGTTFHSAAMRLKLDVDLAPQSPDVSALTAVLPGISAAEMTLSSFSLYAETARGSGAIAAIDAAVGSVTVTATPGVADFYLGRIADAVFADRSRRIDPASDLEFAPLGELRLTDAISGEVTSVAVTARSHAAGEAPGTATLFFAGPYPETQTAGSGSGVAARLASDLINNLDVRTEPGLGDADPQLQATLATILIPALTPTAGLLAGEVLDPAFKQMGIGFGEMDVTVDALGGGCAISGRVYHDRDHDGRRDAAEGATGETHYAKLLAAGQGGPALQVAAVDATGGYRFAGVAPGNYEVLIGNTAAAEAVAPAAPAGWLATVPAPPRRSGLSLVDADLIDQDFGFYAGSRLQGSVFRDTGALANDGIRQADESGIAGVAVELRAAGDATPLDRAASAADGNWILWAPASAANLRVVEQNPAGHLSTGAELGNSGNSGASYERASDTLAFAHTPGSDYRGLHFGDVPQGRFEPDGQQGALPGSVLFYRHSYVAGSRGRLELAATAGATPPTPGWNALLYRDLDCNGAVDPDDARLADSVGLEPGERLCLVAKVFVPAQAPFDARHELSLAASFRHDNAPGIDYSLNRSDLTTVGSHAALRLAKRVDKTAARPGEIVTYTIAYRNDGSGDLADLRIADAVPSHTVFVAAACAVPPPGAVCAVAAEPAADGRGAIEWRIDGALRPGGEGSVSFTVRLD